MLIVIYNFTKSALYYGTVVPTRCSYVYVCVVLGMHEEDTGMKGYFYVLFVSLVALLGKQGESKDKRSTKRLKKFEKTMRDVARKSEG